MAKKSALAIAAKSNMFVKLHVDDGCSKGKSMLDGRTIMKEFGPSSDHSLFREGFGRKI